MPYAPIEETTVSSDFQVQNGPKYQCSLITVIWMKGLGAALLVEIRSFWYGFIENIYNFLHPYSLRHYFSPENCMLLHITQSYRASLYGPCLFYAPCLIVVVSGCPHPISCYTMSFIGNFRVLYFYCIKLWQFILRYRILNL